MLLSGRNSVPPQPTTEVCRWPIGCPSPSESVRVRPTAGRAGGAVRVRPSPSESVRPLAGPVVLSDRLSESVRVRPSPSDRWPGRWCCPIGCPSPEGCRRVRRGRPLGVGIGRDQLTGHGFPGRCAQPSPLAVGRTTPAVSDAASGAGAALAAGGRAGQPIAASPADRLAADDAGARLGAAHGSVARTRTAASTQGRQR